MHMPYASVTRCACGAGVGREAYDGWGTSVSARSWLAHELHGPRLREFSPRAQLGEFFSFPFFCFVFYLNFHIPNLISNLIFKFQSKCNNQSIIMNAKYTLFISIYKWAYFFI
jgi:hypothetical protein